MTFDDLREKYPQMSAIIDDFEILLREVESVNLLCADVLQALYNSDLERAIGLLEKQAAKVITNVHFRS